MVQSCAINKDKTIEKKVDVETYIQRVIPGAEEETPHYRIVFKTSPKALITSIDSANCDGDIRVIKPNSKNEFEMHVPNNKTKTPFKIYYNIDGKAYFTNITEVKTLEADYRP
jgi:hypothetical protein